MKVRCVPTQGINTSADRNTPTRLPIVESAYRRPATCPACSTESTASRIAQGEIAPSSSTGSATSTSTAASEPMNAPASTVSSARTAACRKGPATSGTTASSTAAASTVRRRSRSCGWRSAKRPPSQYPTDRATRTTPIVLAQMTVEAPKSGASRRAAEISAPRLAAPPTNTSASSGPSPFECDSSPVGGAGGSASAGTASSVPLGSIGRG